MSESNSSKSLCVTLSKETENGNSTLLHSSMKEEKQILTKYKTLYPRQKDKAFKKTLNMNFHLRDRLLVTNNIVFGLKDEVAIKDNELKYLKDSSGPLSEDQEKEVNNMLSTFGKQQKLNRSEEDWNQLNKLVESKLKALRNHLDIE